MMPRLGLAVEYRVFQARRTCNKMLGRVVSDDAPDLAGVDSSCQDYVLKSEVAAHPLDQPVPNASGESRSVSGSVFISLRNKALQEGDRHQTQGRRGLLLARLPCAATKTPTKGRRPQYLGARLVIRTPGPANESRLWWASGPAHADSPQISPLNSLFPPQAKSQDASYLPQHLLLNTLPPQIVERPPPPAEVVPLLVRVHG